MRSQTEGCILLGETRNQWGGASLRGISNIQHRGPRWRDRGQWGMRTSNVQVKVARAFLPEGKAGQRLKALGEYPISNKEYPMSKLNALRGIGWAGGRASPRAVKGEALPYHSAGQRPVYGAYNKIKAESLAYVQRLPCAIVRKAFSLVGWVSPCRRALPYAIIARPLVLCFVALERLKTLENIQYPTGNIQRPSEGGSGIPARGQGTAKADALENIQYPTGNIQRPS